MRVYHVAIAVVAVVLSGFAVKLIFFSAPIAEASLLSVKSIRMDISELHRSSKSLPVQKIDDMTFVFSD